MAGNLSAQADKYVNAATGSDANDGNSWATAYASLSHAIVNSVAGDEIWVAAGVYKPALNLDGLPTNFPSDRTFGFNATWRVLYGGFPASGNPGFADRNGETFLTILSGDVENNDFNTDGNFISETYLDNVGDNVHTVVRLQNVGTQMVVDGFIITAGNFAGQGAGMSNSAFSGLTSSPTISNCKFIGNQTKFLRGGGFANSVRGGGTGEPTVTNCIFTGNRASCCGGGIYTGVDLGGGLCGGIIQNCLINGNVTSGVGGGANNDIPIAQGGGTLSTLYLDCTFSFNTANQGGGLCFITDGTGTITGGAQNCKFIANSTTFNPASTSANNGSGGGAFNGGRTPATAVNNSQWVNCLFLGNKAATNGGALRNGRANATQLSVIAPSFINCTFAGNNGTNGALNENFGSQATYKNCIAWANTGGLVTFHSSANVTIENSVVQGGCPPSNATCNNVINADPRFISAPNPANAPSSAGNTHLQDCSAATDLGDNSVAPATDLEGNDRLFDGNGDGNDQTDAGAFERQTTAATTWNGNVSLTTQAQVNAFSHCYSVIDGNLNIQNSGINSLANLAHLVQVTGMVTIKQTSLTNLNGLHNLSSIGNHLRIFNNHFGAKLQSLDGLEALASVGGNLSVYNNSSLGDCCAIHDLLNQPGGVGGQIGIFLNETGCDNLEDVNEACDGNLLPPGNGESLIEEPRGEMNFEMESKQPVSVQPNPASGETDLLFDLEFLNGRVEVFDVTGKRLLSMNLEANATQTRLPLRDLTAGIYLVKTNLDDVIFLKRVVVE